jgi:hypothetical protein
MANINLPPNVKQDPNTGLYLITNAQGKTVRVNADTQEQLNQYVNSVNTGVPATVTVTDPNTGNPRTRTFDSNAMISQQESVANQQQLLTAGKRQAGVIGNRDGSYQDLKTGRTISQEEAAAKIQAAGLPPATLQAVTPKDSPAYVAAQQSIDQTATVPSNIPPAEALQPVQSSGGNSTSVEVTSSVPAPEPAPAVAAAAEPANTEDPYTGGARAGAGEEFVQNDAPPAQEFDTPLLTPAESIAQAQTTAPADVAPANTGVFANPNFSQEAITGSPAAVDPEQDQSAAESARLGRGAADAADAASNESTAETARLNRYDNAAAENAILQKTREQPAIQAQFQSPASGDWRVRLRLAPNAEYLYKDSGNEILKPLLASDGVVFPYMPTIQTSYNASYENTELTHSNYRGQFYKSSYVGDISLSGTFTAQDTVEANYLLAVIHFFRSVTKMFYGQDAERGAPPPLVYLIGLGEYQFNNQPCVVSSFNYSLPNDVDYIRTKPNNYNINLGPRQTKSDNGPFGQISSIINRLQNAALPKGALPGIPDQSLVTAQSVTNIDNNTYVPTRMDIQLTLLPIQTRSQQSQQFSVKQFANGNLLKGGFW